MRQQVTVILGLVVIGAAAVLGGCSSEFQSTAPQVGPMDGAPPLPPTGLMAPEGKISPDGFLLVWNPNTEPDFAGYRIYRGGPDAGRGIGYVLTNPDFLVPDTRLTLQGDMNTGVWIRLTAVDAAGNESRPSDSILVQYTGGTLDQQQQPTGGSDTNTGRGFGPVGGPDRPRGPDDTTPNQGGNQ